MPEITKGECIVKIPDKVVISGMEYTVKLEDKALFCGSQRAYAQIDFEKKEIAIDQSMQEAQGQQQSLWHEIIHGIVYDRELDFEKQKEETIVDQLAKGLYQVIRENPRLFE